MDTTINSFLFMCVYFLGIFSSATGVFRCYACSECPHHLNLTWDSYIIKHGCSRCLLSTKVEATDKTLSYRRCMTRRMEKYFLNIGIDVRDGCANITQIPFVTEVKHLCFCSKDLCNSSANFNGNYLALLLLEIVSLLFNYG